MADVQYLWRRNQIKPYAKEINCKNCDFNNITKISDEDLSFLSQIGNIQLHRTRVLQRVIPGSIEPPIAVKEVVDAYLPRSLAVISSLINKLDSLNVTQEKRRIIDALLINVFDYGNMLWSVTSGRTRPKQITIPAEFYEFNLWNILELSIPKFQIMDRPVPFSIYPEFPPESGGICFYPGRISNIKDLNALPKFQAVASVLPRPNQALWTLNAVWSGWLWGQEAAKKLKGALERRRYDWIWHSQAIQTVFKFISKLKIPFLAVAPELTSSYILAYLSAAASSEFQLKGTAFHPEQKSGQFYWFPQKTSFTLSTDASLSTNLKKYLELKCEPANYQELMSIFFISETIDQNNLLEINKFDNSLFIRSQKLFENTLSNEKIFIQVDDDQLENADFWLKNPPNIYQPHSDQIEGIFIRYILKNPIFDYEEMLYFLNQSLPGFLPVPQFFFQRLLYSYCEPDQNVPNQYKLKTQEYAENRKNDINEMVKIIHSIGNKIGFSVSGENPCTWDSDLLKPRYKFFITASSIISQFSTKFQKEIFESVVILPGSRAELLSFKLKNDPIYNQIFEKNHIVKFRHLRSIMENPDLNLRNWGQILDSDPAVWQEANQPVLF